MQKLRPRLRQPLYCRLLDRFCQTLYQQRPKKGDVLTQLRMFNIYHSRLFLLTSHPQVGLRGHDRQDAIISQEIGIQDQQIL